jgi:hypothetical protein
LAEIPVQRTTSAPLWPWLLGLLLLAGVGLLIWAFTDNDDDKAISVGGQASMSARGEANAAAGSAKNDNVSAVVNPPGPGNTAIGVAKPIGDDLVVAVGKPIGADKPTVMVVDRVKDDETAAQAARDAAVTAATLAVEEQPVKLAGRLFMMDDVSVTDVAGDKVFWVSPQGLNLTYLAALDEQKVPGDGVEGRHAIEKGMRLSLLGVIKRLDA